MAIEIVSFPMKNGGSFHSYVSLPEGKPPFSYGFPMVFPSKPPTTYGFPMVCGQKKSALPGSSPFEVVLLDSSGMAFSRSDENKRP